MWVRNQNRDAIFSVYTEFNIKGYSNSVSYDRAIYYIYSFSKVDGEELELGKYSTKEKAIKVLDKIQLHINGFDGTVFQMPLEEEV